MRSLTENARYWWPRWTVSMWTSTSEGVHLAWDTMSLYFFSSDLSWSGTVAFAGGVKWVIVLCSVYESHALDWHPLVTGSQLNLHFRDILDPYFILNILRAFNFDKIYHFAAQSHVSVSFNIQLYTCDVNTLGTLCIVQAIITLQLEESVKFYNVSHPFWLSQV